MADDETICPYCEQPSSGDCRIAETQYDASLGCLWWEDFKAAEEERYAALRRIIETADKVTTALQNGATMDSIGINVTHMSNEEFMELLKTVPIRCRPTSPFPATPSGAPGSR